jgi:hypothetical protein
MRLERRRDQVSASAAFAVIAMTVIGCGINPLRDEMPAEPQAIATTSPAAFYRPPANPCAAAPPELVKRLGLSDPVPQVITQYVTDDATPQDPLVVYDVVSCTWGVKNPARGPAGRPNEMTMEVAYAVLPPRRHNAAAVAHQVYVSARERLRQHEDVTIVREGEPHVPADDGHYVHATRRTPTGTGSEAEATVRVGNVVVTVRFSGADLTLDTTLPRGLQLVTKPVAESRLKPAVTVLLPEAVGALR